MKRYLACAFVLTVLLMWSASSLAQAKDKEKEREQTNFLVGGDFRIDAFAVQFNFDVYPYLAYQVHEDIRVGVGPFYFFRRNAFVKRNLHYFGSKVFLQYYYRNWFVHGEGELLYVDSDYLESFNISFSNPYKRLEGIVVGGGYQARFSEYLNMYVLLGWNVNRKQFTPYDNPVMRIGVTYNL